MQFYFESISEAEFEKLPDKASFRIESIKVIKSMRYLNMSGLEVKTSNGRTWTLGEPRFFDHDRHYTCELKDFDLEEIQFTGTQDNWHGAPLGFRLISRDPSAIDIATWPKIQYGIGIQGIDKPYVKLTEG